MCARFCEIYDQPSFNPKYNCDSLESFRPMVAAVLSKTPFWWESKTGDKMDCKARLAADICSRFAILVPVHEEITLVYLIFGCLLHYKYAVQLVSDVFTH
jgi:hypothetical protein